MALFPLELEADSPAYLRYNLVKLTATFVDATGRKIAAKTPPEVTVSAGGEMVTTVGNLERLKLRFDHATQTYVGHWPVPWNAPPGVYIAEATLKVPGPEQWVWETPEAKKRRQQAERRSRKTPEEDRPTGEMQCIARARFVIQAAQRASIPPGTCVATWEPHFLETGIPRPDGSIGDWHAMLDWCEFMGADTFWMRAAVTEAYQRQLTDEAPFEPYSLQSVPMVAREAHRRGLRFGAWAAAYSTYPVNNRRKPPYLWAKDISRTTGKITDLDFISLFEPKRVSHLGRLFAQLQADEYVDYLGLDYMRSDRGGYEMTDRFTTEMPLKLPDGFFQRSQRERWSYVAKKIESEWQTDPDFYDAWNWYRAHIGAQNLRDIIAVGQLKKPVWIFVLSWWHGKQHGQDPLMFTDAGVGVLAPMLYEVPSRRLFDSMVSDWNDYLSAGQANIMPGDQVDWLVHQKTTVPAGPEELYDRMVTAHRKYERGGLTIGSFWHDISRAAVLGRRGPYPGTEWALAGGAAFSTVRTNWGVYPLAASLEGSSTVAVGASSRLTLNLANVVKHGVRDIRIKLEPTPGVEQVGRLEPVSSLGAERTTTIPVDFRVKARNGERANRFMVAVRLTWPEGDYGKSVRNDLPRTLIVMKYVQAR